MKPEPLPKGKIERKNGSLYLRPAKGGGYYLPYHLVDAVVCPACQGDGHWDSCFNCGNRGYM